MSTQSEKAHEATEGAQGQAPNLGELGELMRRLLEPINKELEELRGRVGELKSGESDYAQTHSRDVIREGEVLPEGLRLQKQGGAWVVIESHHDGRGSHEGSPKLLSAAARAKPLQKYPEDCGHDQGSQDNRDLGGPSGEFTRPTPIWMKS